jgi:hypothetical protein
LSLTGSTVSLYFGPHHRSTLNLPLLKANCFRPEGNTSLPYWRADVGEDGRGQCQELSDDD